MRIRRVILIALVHISQERSMPYLVDALGYSDSSLQQTAASLIGQIGLPAMQSVLFALQNSKQEEGALLALQNLPVPPEKPIEGFATAAVSRAVGYEVVRRAVKSQSQNEAVNLLGESLQKTSNEHGLHALRAVGLLGDRDSMNLAIDILSMRDTTQRANVI